MATTPVMFQVPVEMLAAIDAYCTTNQVSRAAMMREAIAGHIGYNRLPKAVDPAARKAAQKAKQKEQRQKVQALVRAFKNGERAEDIAALAKSMGISPEDI